MTEKNSLVEEAIIQMKNLEELVAENAKGILASTMKQEIKELVKESLKEQDEEEPEVDDEEDMDIEEPEMDDEEEMDMDEPEMDDEEELDTEPSMDDETLDLTGMDSESVVKIFAALDDTDEVEVIPDQQPGKVHFKDNRTNKEYIIMTESEIEQEVNKTIRDTFSESDFEDEYYSDEEEEEEEEENFDFYPDEEEDYSDEEGFDFSPDEEEEEEEEDFDFYPNKEEETIYEIEMDSTTVSTTIRGKNNGGSSTTVSTTIRGMKEETIYELEIDEMPDMDYMKMDEMYGDGEEFDEEYMDMDEMYDEFEEEDMEDMNMMESKKSTKKPKGMGFGSASKFKYPSKTTDYPTKKQSQGTRGVGMGKVPKDIYKGDSPSFKGEFSKKPTSSRKEAKEGMMKPTKPMMKKMETKEASRTLGNGKYWGREGLPKPKSSPRHIRKESIDNSELQILREKNDEYRKALNIFRNKLDEVAIFNSNLAYATRLFTEHSTSKQEKINILKRFDGVETLKESKNLYKIIKDELTSSKPQPVNESVERVITKTQSTGSAINLIESKTYENPQFLRMKDLMSKLK